MSTELKAVIYARYSSSNQREESIEGQIRECKEYAKRKNIQIINQYIDRALTGKNDNRPAFLEMIKDSSLKTFNLVLCYKVDRFARNRFDSAIYKAKLKKNGVTVEYAKEQIPDTPEGIILESMLEGFAEYYSANLGVNTRRGKKENALKGKLNGGVTPYGYIRKNGNFEIDAEKSKIIKFIYNSYIEGISFSKIIQDIRNIYNETFSKSGIKNILNNPVYTGLYIYNTYEGEQFKIENHHPAIIPSETFTQAEKRRAINKRSPNANKGKKKYVLSGLCRCGECGAPFIITHSYKNGEPIYYRMTCNNRKEKKSCTNKTRKMDLIENAVIKAIKEKILNPQMIHALSEKAFNLQETASISTLKDFQNELKSIQKSKDNIIKAIEMGIFTPTTKSRLEELERAETEIQLKIAKEKSTAPENLSIGQIEDFLTFFCNGDFTDNTFRIELAKTFVKTVLIFQDRAEIFLQLHEIEIKEILTF